MLLTLLRSGAMHETIASADSYRPAWTARDRSLWDGCGEQWRNFWIARAERHLGFDWPPLEPLYSDYQQTGNRTRFEAVYHRRRQVAATFVFAEAFENQGRFIGPLLDAIDRLCDEPTWVLPAHDKHVIDLFSAETANMLAWTCYLFAHVPSFRDAGATERARQVITSRVIDPYIARDDCWWMALNGEAPGNWTTWCTSNCLGTTLLLETDAGRRASAIEKACRSLDRFVDAYGEDGGCDEGPMYWNFAAGCLFDALEMLFEASGGAFDVFGDPRIRNIGAYITKVHVHNLYFVNFADSPPQVPVDAALLYRFGRHVKDAHMQALGAHFYRLLDRYDPEDTLRLKVYRALATFADSSPLRQVPGPDAAPLESYLPKLQVAVLRETPETGAGLVLAAKGGHNHEQHNHNDVGLFIVYVDGRPVLVDVGLKQYTKDSFSERRYENWVVQSGYHNVPLVNGCMQEPGARFAASDAAFTTQDGCASFSVDIAGAYPADAGLVRWTRTSTLARMTPSITIHDDFQFAASGNCYEQRFMSACLPHVVEGAIVFDVDDTRALVMRTSPAPNRISLHTFTLKDGQLRHAWGGTIYQIRLYFDDVESHGRCETVVIARRGTRDAAPGSEVALEVGELL